MRTVSGVPTTGTAKSPAFETEGAKHIVKSAKDTVAKTVKDFNTDYIRVDTAICRACRKLFFRHIWQVYRTQDLQTCPQRIRRDLSLQACAG